MWSQSLSFEFQSGNARGNQIPVPPRPLWSSFAFGAGRWEGLSLLQWAEYSERHLSCWQMLAPNRCLPRKVSWTYYGDHGLSPKAPGRQTGLLRNPYNTSLKFPLCKNWRRNRRLRNLPWFRRISKNPAPLLNHSPTGFFLFFHYINLCFFIIAFCIQDYVFLSWPASRWMPER